MKQGSILREVRAPANGGELGLDALAQKYPGVPRFLILKMDLQRRGVRYTERALEVAHGEAYQGRAASFLYGRAYEIEKELPEGLLLRDGTSVCLHRVDIALAEENDSYVIDAVDGKTMIFDRGEFVDECEFWPKPDYYGKKTSRGIPMESIVNARPQRLSLCSPSHCFFFDGHQGQCKFCSFVPDLRDQVKAKVGRVARLNPEDVYETVTEALKEDGRWTSICLSGGSDYRGNPAFQSEVNHYIDLIKAIGRNFRAGRFPIQLVSTAFSKEQLRRLYDETGLVGYTADIEVWDAKLFEWICPGKSKWVGRNGWIESLIDAVDIFGKGNVDTNIVAGIEMAEPYGFKTEDEALESNFEAAEFFARHGVGLIFTVWTPRQETLLQDQKQPSLEYHVRLLKGFHEIWKKYGLTMDCDDYRHCGNHAVTDIIRPD